jgi:hypothetical protein
MKNNEYRQSRFATMVALAIAMPGILLALEGYYEASVRDVILGGAYFGGIIGWLVIFGARYIFVTDNLGVLVKKGIFRRYIPYDQFNRASTKIESGRHMSFLFVLAFTAGGRRKELRFAVKSFPLADIKGLVNEISEHSPKFVVGRGVDELLSEVKDPLSGA